MRVRRTPWGGYDWLALLFRSGCTCLRKQTAHDMNRRVVLSEVLRQKRLCMRMSTSMGMSIKHEHEYKT